MLTQTLLKRLKLWPVLGIIGSRQCGKSTLLREILPEFLKTKYSTMDSESTRNRASKSPESFAEPVDGFINIVDEIQKAPALFDAVKLHVDRKRRPGTYILSGSTQFSAMAGVRESLTGRIAILNLYPFNLTEIHSKNFSEFLGKRGHFTSKISLREFDQKIQNGGMPGFFYLHSKPEFSAAAQFWVETTCFRDLGQIIRKNFDGELALSILTALAQTDVPTAKEVADRIEKDPRVVRRYLDGFAEILVTKKIAPHHKSVGKHHYIFIDSGIASFLGASRETALRSHVLIEALSYFEAKGQSRPQVEYYHSEKKSYVPLIFSWKNEKKIIALQISDREVPKLGEIKSLESFSARIEGQKVRSLLLCQANESYLQNGIEFHPIRA